ncbi:FAD-binding oxidoreductase [Catellatospora sp. NPDC049111]|uniref:FAD-binding oxidoreductase n=1 Tax=Catellatospora sp. NPDC049111 TaxID=3155271 RepID=UPI0033F0484F
MTAPVREESELDGLRLGCPVRPAGALDTVDGALVRWVAAPRDPAEAAALMRRAHELGLTVLPRGSGSKSSWLDPPPVVDLLVDLSDLATLHYDPTTEQLTVGAGAGVAATQDVLARSGRRLALDPPSPRATFGGVLAAAEFGPLTHLYGPPAVQVVDATVVLPDGTVTTVADRARLLGSSIFDLRWTHPGGPHPACLIVEVTLRTYPLAPAASWVVCPVLQPLQVATLRDDVLAANLAPAAIELDMPGIRRTPQAGGRRDATGVMAVLLEGSPVSLADRGRLLVRRLGGHAHLTTQAPLWWGKYPFRPGEVAVRLYAPEGDLHSVCYTLVDAIGSPVPVRGSIGVGQAWAAVPGELPAGRLVSVLETLREVLLARSGSAVVQAAPPHLRELLAPYRVP